MRGRSFHHEDVDFESARRQMLAEGAIHAQAGLRHMLVEPTPEAPVPFGEYELLRRIGAGGMGEVFLARETTSSTPRACVVKKVLPNLIANRAFVGRFLDEAKVVVRLNHTNIARVYAMGDVAGEYFLTMEYVQGKTVSRFSKRLRDKRLELPVGLALFIGEKVCEGLQYAHLAKDDRGELLHLVHRDLSPANVCVSYQGDVKIIDFGAASSTLKEEQTAPRVVIGNLTYMAPEQAKKQIVDGRADLYSLGVLLWELLTAFALPQKGDPIERWRKAAHPTWDAPSKLKNGIPKDVDAVILKALQPQAKDRYADAAAFGKALREVRRRYAPNATERELGALLSKAFSKEKAAEDAVLAQAVYGKALSEKDKTQRVKLVPPTALAFEHTAVLHTGDFEVPKDQEITDPERANPAPDPEVTPSVPAPRQTVELAPPTSPVVTPKAPAQPVLVPPPRPKVNATRTSFGVTFHEQEPQIEPVLRQEIEPYAESGISPELYVSSSPFEELDDEPPLPGWAKAVAFGGIFALAVSLGFLAVWALLR